MLSSIGIRTKGNYSIFLGRVAVPETKKLRYGYGQRFLMHVCDVLGLRLTNPRDRRRQRYPWKTVPASHVGSFDCPNDQHQTLLLTLSVTLSLFVTALSLITLLWTVLYIETMQVKILSRVTDSATDRNSHQNTCSYPTTTLTP